MNVVWFRNDLRTDDNPALYHACKDNDEPVVAIYLLCEKQWDLHDMGANQRALIIKALENLRASLKELNIPLLVIDAGSFANVPSNLLQLSKWLAIKYLYFNIEYPSNERRRDRLVCDTLDGIVKCYRLVGQSLSAPWKVVNGQKEGYKVFSAYERQVHRYLDKEPVNCVPAPSPQSSDNLSQGGSVKTVELPNIIPTATVIPDVSESSLLKQLKTFTKGAMADYPTDRDFPSINGTSQLSSALAIGALSVRRCYTLAKQQPSEKANPWIRQLMWRDFYRSIMWHYPRVSRNKGFVEYESDIVWDQSESFLKAWKIGETGVPIIDAAMRQLSTTGWMHNRLRMVVASYLTKNLWIDWREGEKHFANHLYDFDFANNNGGWQWSASVGTDAAPYFRVFNPLSQQKRFDENAEFIKHWLPQLKGFSAKELHQSDTKLLKNYHQPLVDLKHSRQRAIDEFKLTKNSA